jgi:hypothetical protein
LSVEVGREVKSNRIWIEFRSDLVSKRRFVPGATNVIINLPARGGMEGSGISPATGGAAEWGSRFAEASRASGANWGNRYP